MFSFLPLDYSLHIVQLTSFGFFAGRVEQNHRRNSNIMKLCVIYGEITPFARHISVVKKKAAYHSAGSNVRDFWPCDSFISIYPSICSSIRSFVRSFLPSFLPSFVRSFVRSFIHSFIHSFTLPLAVRPSALRTVHLSINKSAHFHFLFKTFKNLNSLQQNWVIGPSKTLVGFIT